MKLVEHWRWRWRSPESGEVAESSLPLTVRDAALRCPGAERIPGTARMLPDRASTQSYEETTPAAFYRQAD